MAPWSGPTWLVISMARLRSVRRPARKPPSSARMGAPDTVPARARRRDAGAVSARSAAESADTLSTETVPTVAGSFLGLCTSGFLHRERGVCVPGDVQLIANLDL